MKYKKSFIHYTSAEAAKSILENKQVWLRQTSCMNDFMEVQYGRECLIRFYRDKCGLSDVLDEIFPGLGEEVARQFDTLMSLVTSDLFICCFSEHEDEEDTYGRLSMWRAYGKDSGVGIVLNSAPFFNETNAYNAYTVPVLYKSETEFREYLKSVALNIKNNSEIFKEMGMQSLKSWAVVMLKLTVVTTKHKGFKEENEWRVVYMPKIFKSKHILQSLEVISGIPQDIYKIPLEDIPEENVFGLDFNSFIKSIIIGPTKYPLVLQKAFSGLLEINNVENFDQKVIISDIPLRK